MLVVERRQLLGLDLADRDLEQGLLGGQLGRGIVLGEGDRDVAVLAAHRALELLLEARHEPARAELDHLVAALAAGERHAVHGAGEVHHHEVAALGLAIDGVELGRALAQLLFDLHELPLESLCFDPDRGVRLLRFIEERLELLRLHSEFVRLLPHSAAFGPHLLQSLRQLALGFEGLGSGNAGRLELHRGAAPLVVEVGKVVRRRRQRGPDAASPQAVVAPARARTGVHVP